MAIAIATLMVASGLSVAPAALAGHNDCHEDFDITSTRQTRSLDVGESEVGLSEVSAPSDEIMNVTLDSNNAKLEVTIHELDGTDCVESSNVETDCQGTFKLKTTGSATTDSKECTLFAPNLGDRDFYVLFDNVGSTSLNYTTSSS